MLNNQKGITLVALVVTIIVLIILATVAISFAFGSNGIITRAEDAAGLYTNDAGTLDSLESYIDDYLESKGITGE